MSQRRGHVRRGRYEEAAAAFEEALRLWRGPALSELRGGPIIRGFVTWLEEARLECTELLAEANLALGRHRESVGFLYDLTQHHPLREVFSRQLMLALYRSDRRADALKVYRSVRESLHDELGLEPCRALSDLHRAILQSDAHLEVHGTRTAR